MTTTPAAIDTSAVLSVSLYRGPRGTSAPQVQIEWVPGTDTEAAWAQPRFRAWVLAEAGLNADQHRLGGGELSSASDGRLYELVEVEG